MTVVRRIRTAVDGTPPAAPVKARWISAALDGAAPISGHVRWLRAAVDGAPAVIVNPLPDLANVEPESTVTITATLVGGGTADTWTWRRISGPAIGLFGTGPSVSFPAPSVIDGGTLVIGVTATLAGITSTEDTFSITVLPQTEWLWTGTGWIPNVELFAAP